MQTIHFKVVTPERVVFEGRVRQVTVPTEAGEITILPHHIPLVTNIASGELRIQEPDGREHYLAVSGGVAEVSLNTVLILADTADRAQEISEEQARAAHERAQELLKTRAGIPDQQYAALQALMDRELARLKVARKYRERGIRTGDTT